jgi:hypothetical protein
VVEFLKHLMRHIPGPMILIWDRLSAHKSRMAQNFIAEQHGRIHPEYVPVSGVGLKSGGIPVGSLEAARTAQRLSKGLVGLERTSPPNFTENAPTPPADCCFLEAG